MLIVLGEAVIVSGHGVSFRTFLAFVVYCSRGV